MIYVFKTNVHSKKQVEQLGPHIDRLLDGDLWNFDLDDCDRILRIDSGVDIVSKIRELMTMHQFYCEELE